MVKKVTKYQAADGTLFDTLADAKKHEHETGGRADIASALDEIGSYGTVKLDSLMRELTDESSDLIAAIMNYHEIPPQ